MAQRYRKDEFIGKGAYGSVYKAYDLATNQVVAIKILNLDTREDEVRDIQREIATLSQLSNKYITRYHGSLLNGTRLWITMDYAAGGSIRDLIEAGPIGESYISTITHDVLQALVYLHRNDIIHRDIKAANILMTEDGTVQLCDFGVARSISSTSMRRYSFAGTPYWMAPEVISQSSGYDAKVDIWSLGITVYEMATGNPPHAEQDPKRVLYLAVKSAPPKLGASHSAAIRDFVASCLQVQPEDRPMADQLLKSKFIKHHKRHNLKDLLGRSRKPWSADLMGDKPSVSSVSSESTGFDVEPVASDDDDNGWDFNQPLASATAAEASEHPRASHAEASLPEHLYRSTGDLVSQPPQFVQDLFSSDPQAFTRGAGEPRDGLYPGITGHPMTTVTNHSLTTQRGLPVQLNSGLVNPSGGYLPSSSDQLAELPAQLGAMPVPEGLPSRSSIHVPSGSAGFPRMSLGHAHIPRQSRIAADASSMVPPLPEQPVDTGASTRYRSNSHRPPPLSVMPGPPSAQPPTHAFPDSNSGPSLGSPHHISLPGAGGVGPLPASVANGPAAHRHKPSTYYEGDSVRPDDMALLSLPPPIHVRPLQSSSDQMGGTNGLDYRASVDGVPMTSPTGPTSSALSSKSGSHSFIRAPLRRVRSFHSAKKKALAHLRLPSALQPHLYHKLKHGSSGSGSGNVGGGGGGLPSSWDHSPRASDIKITVLSASSSSKSGSNSVALAPGGGSGRLDRDGAVVGQDAGLFKPLSVQLVGNDSPVTGAQGSPSSGRRGRSDSTGAASAMAPSNAAELQYQQLPHAMNASAAMGLSGALRKSSSLHSLSKPGAEHRRPQPTDLVPPSPSRFSPPLFGTARLYPRLGVSATQPQDRGWRSHTLHTRSHSSTWYDTRSNSAGGEQLVPPMECIPAHGSCQSSGWRWSSWHLPSDAPAATAAAGKLPNGMDGTAPNRTAVHRVHSLEARPLDSDGLSSLDDTPPWTAAQTFTQQPSSSCDHSVLFPKSGSSAVLDPHLHKALASQASSRRSHTNLKTAAHPQASRQTLGMNPAQPWASYHGSAVAEPMGSLPGSVSGPSDLPRPSATSAPSDAMVGRSLTSDGKQPVTKAVGTLPAQTSFDLMCDPTWVRKKVALSLLEVQEWINVIQQDFEKLAL
ncbi:kinase that interacts with cdc31p [Dimargaris xerosporica]|nr:kinase that interacts with cdc31p [Dimargaris xerosporica]